MKANRPLLIALGWSLALAASTALAVGCDPDISVCELPDDLNTCEDDGDCLLLYCGVNCCPCKVAASRAQFEETYCMVDVDEGYDAARRHCEEARDTICDGVSCTGEKACPHFTRVACEGGRCHAH